MSKAQSYQRISIKKKAERLRDIQAELKALYEESDMLSEQISKHYNFPDYEEIDFEDFHLVIEDRFREKNLVWQPVAVRRYVVKVKE